MSPFVKISVWGFRCLRCGHEWVPRGKELPADGTKPPDPAPGEEPKVCPKCKSPYWNKPRRKPEG